MTRTAAPPALTTDRRPLTGPQSAAVAKLTYAVAERHTLTLLCGPGGVGKSTVLRCLAAEIQAQGRAVRLLSWSHLRGETPDPGRVPRSPPAAVVPGAGGDAPPDVLLIDDAHRAVGLELADFVEQWRCDREDTVMVMAGQGRLLSLVAGDARLEHSVRLRATLPAFTLDETRTLLAPSLPAAAAAAHAEDVIRTIHEIAGGAPAVALRLADMVAMLAAAAPGCPLDADAVETIHRRLSLNAA